MPAGRVSHKGAKEQRRKDLPETQIKCSIASSDYRIKALFLFALGAFAPLREKIALSLQQLPFQYQLHDCFFISAADGDRMRTDHNAVCVDTIDT
jgi:hypothetical protein